MQSQLRRGGIRDRKFVWSRLSSRGFATGRSVFFPELRFQVIPQSDRIVVLTVVRTVDKCDRPLRAQPSGSDRTLPDVVPVRLDKGAETLPISWDHDRTTAAVRHWAQRPSRRGTVTLVYSSHDREHNNAIALRAYLETKLGKKHRATSRKSSA